MTTEMRRKFANGMEWAATTQVKGGGIIVPVNDLSQLSDEETIQMLRSMTDMARFLVACDYVDYIQNSIRPGRHWYLNVLSILSKTEEIEDLIREFADQDSDVAEALALIEKAKAEKQSRDAGKASAGQKRRDIKSRYDTLFVDVGRRDGFSCAMCGHTGNDLQLDHVAPVAKGGTNDLGNLQLLCPPCNLTKSDRQLINR